MTKFVTNGLMALVLVTAAAVPALGQISAIDYVGFGYETGGIPSSSPGDELVITCVADDLDPIFGIDLGVEEVTFHVYGLVSAGEMVIAGNTVINYAGGYLEIYQDAAQNADWGVNPPNPTSPAYFTDGSLLFQGAFSAFTMFFAPGGYGSFEGTVDALGGTMIDGSCTGCVYTWGGSFQTTSGAQIPEGYDLQIDGVFQIDSAVSNESATFGSVKALFAN